MYYNVGDFIEGKKNGNVFRITGIIMEKKGGFQYSIVPVKFVINDLKVIDAREIYNFDKI